MKKNDIKVLIFIAVGLGILFCIWKITFSKEGSLVEISVDNNIVYTTNLYNSCYICIKNDGNCTILTDVDDYDGIGNLLVIDGGKADMVMADCPDKICVGMPAISNEDECIVCMPNKVIVTVK